MMTTLYVTSLLNKQIQNIVNVDIFNCFRLIVVTSGDIKSMLDELNKKATMIYHYHHLILTEYQGTQGRYVYN